MKKSVLFLVIVLASITVGSAFAITIRFAGDVTIDGTLTTGGVIISPTITSLQSQIDAVAGPVSPDADGDTLQGIDSTGFVQSLQSCSAGQLVVGFDSSGIETCSQISFTRNIRTVLDSGASEAHGIAIGNDGFPIIAYEFSPDVKVVHCTNASCSSFDSPITLVSGNVGQGLGLTIGGDGNAAVVHRTNAGADLIFTHCTDVTCTATDTSQTLDGPIFTRVAIATASDGFPIILYGTQNVFDTDMKIIHCTNASCSTRVGPNTFDTIRAPLIFSIAIGNDNLPIITYSDGAAFNFFVAHCNTTPCDDVITKTTLDSDSSTIGASSSIVIGTDGFPIIAYGGVNGATLKIIHCTNVTCSTSDPAITLDVGSANASSDSARRVVMALDSDGNPVILYVDSNDILLKLIQCTSTDCSTFDPPEILDIDNVDGDEINDITIGNDGRPILVDSIIDVTVIQIGGFGIP